MARVWRRDVCGIAVSYRDTKLCQADRFAVNMTYAARQPGSLGPSKLNTQKNMR